MAPTAASPFLHDGMALGKGFRHRRSDTSLVLLPYHVRSVGGHVENLTPLLRYAGTAFGVLAFWGTSGLLLNQNVEARFYGLFILTVAFSVDVYTRLVLQPAPKPGC